MRLIAARLFWLCITPAVILLGGCRGASTRVHHAGGQDSLKTSDSTVQPAAEPPPRSLTFEQQQGKFFYTKYCAVCHGDDGKGDGFNAFNLDPKPRDFTDTKIMNGLSDDHLRETVRGGGAGVNKSSLMPAWGGTLNPRQIDYVVGYLRTFSDQK